MKDQYMITTESNQKILDDAAKFFKNHKAVMKMDTLALLFESVQIGDVRRYVNEGAPIPGHSIVNYLVTQEYIARQPLTQLVYANDQINEIIAGLWPRQGDTVYFEGFSGEALHHTLKLDLGWTATLERRNKVGKLYRTREECQKAIDLTFLIENYKIFCAQEWKKSQRPMYENGLITAEYFFLEDGRVQSIGTLNSNLQYCATWKYRPLGTAALFTQNFTEEQIKQVICY